MSRPITLREAAAVEQICARAADVNSSTINSTDRTVQAVFATEAAVPVFHWDVGRVIDEVLVARGMEPVEHVSMLQMHYRYSLGDVIGSGEQPRVDGDKIVGTLRFGTDLGEEVDNIWKRVEQRHLRSVSAGYDPLEFVDIPAGETRQVMGKSYTAGRRMLRVTTRWRLREISMVVIPADKDANIRAASNNGAERLRDENLKNQQGVGSNTTNRESEMGFLAYLSSLGLAEGANEQAIRSFIGNLSQDQLSHARGLASEAERTKYFGATGRESGDGQGGGAGSGSGGAAPSPSSDPVTDLTGARGGDGASTPTRDQIVAAERQRVGEITRLAADQVPADLRQRAIDEGWDVDRAGREFYAAVIAGRQSPVGHGGHVGIHSRSASSEVTMQALQVGLMMRLGVEPDSRYLSTMQARGMLGRRECQGEWIVDAAYAMRNGNASDEASRAIDIASRRLRRRSLFDIAAECLRMNGIAYDADDREDVIQRAYTVAQFSNIFTTNFSVRLLQGYMEQADSTEGWCGVEDLPNFQDHDLVQMDPFTNLRKKTRNEPGQQVEGGDRKESYAAERFVGTFQLDEQVMMDDNLRGFSRVAPNMGASARRIRPNLVYAILLQNPNLASGTALFATAHGNLAGGAALGSATLSAAEAAMAIQTRNGAVLDIAATHLIVPRTKRHLARRLVGSSELRDTTSSNEYGTMNPNQGEYTVVSDARLDNGFADPDDFQSTIAGQPNSWFLADANSPGIMVGYVQGSGRAPRLRSRIINRPGEYGMEWDVNMDIGAAPADYVGLLKRQTASL